MKPAIAIALTAAGKGVERVSEAEAFYRLAGYRNVTPHFLRILLAVPMLLASASAVLGQTSAPLVAPAEVVLFLPPTLKSRDFIEPLVCALKRVLTAEVYTVNLDIPLGPDLLATRTQLDVQKVVDRFIANTAKYGKSLTFKYLLLPYDLKAPSLNYVFATTFGNQTTPFHVSVVSTARLDVNDPLIEHRTGADITALRVYKLMLKSVARLAGLASPERCILVFPRSLEELDRKSAEFCVEDHDTLVTAGILKAQEADTGDCMAVAGLRPGYRLAADMLPHR
jgi:predicted Zn-dependent protease